MYTRSINQTLNRCLSATSPVAAGAFRPSVAPVSPATRAVLPPRGSEGNPFLPWASVVSRAHALPTVPARCSHTDLQVPDLDYYRNRHTVNPNESSSKSQLSKRAAAYMIMGAGGVVTAGAVKDTVVDLLSSMGPSADVLALAKIEVDLSAIPEGKNAVFKWQGKPLFVRHRTADEIAAAQNVDINILRDPEPDDVRVQKPEWMILIGVCTHLGCVPIANAGEYGGYLCPCHGSHYDTSGRIRKGPAPFNLAVPKYQFESDSTLIVG